MSIEASKTEMQREKRMQRWKKISKNCEAVTKGVSTCVMWIPEGED